MAKKIRLLPENVINKIAAGEVVERPASVVKELVENSIDAHATKIKIEIKDGGKKLIKVTDNGEGLTRDDLLLAFERHATSKIFKTDDLYSIKTLGFRGEALPSIASVAKVRARTKTIDSETGFEIFIEGGILKNISEIACNKGFIIEVKNLFFNVPVRLKFLKKSSTENFHIDNIVKRFAIAYPEVEFRLINNGRETFYPKSYSLKERLQLIFDEKVYKNLIPFRVENIDTVISGYISPPDIASPISNSINIFINGRYIRDKIIFHAIRDAYREKIFDKNYPYVILFLNIPCEKVDVNVHPSKLEVKFQNEKDIYNLIKNNIEEVLKNSSNIFINKKEEKKEKVVDNIGKIKSFLKETIVKYIPQSHEEPIQEDIYSYSEHLETEKICLQKEKEGFYTKYDFLGILDNTFIILTDFKSLILVDQHAAHERILFEKYKKQLHNNKIETKKFLIPEILEIPENYHEPLLNHLSSLEKMGFLIDRLDEKTFTLRGIPQILKDIDYKNFIIQLTIDLEKFGSTVEIEKINDSVIEKIACKAAIKSGTKLDIKNVYNLLKELDSIPNNRTCPHGRPIFIEIDEKEISKRFKRTN